LPDRFGVENAFFEHLGWSAAFCWWRIWTCAKPFFRRKDDMSSLIQRADTAASAQEDRHGPLPALLLVLTAVTGLVDAISYLQLGHVFVANMTGNVIFLGFAAAGAAGFRLPPRWLRPAPFWPAHCWAAASARAWDVTAADSLPMRCTSSSFCSSPP